MSCSVNEIFMKAVSNIICSICFGQRFSYEDPEFLKMLELVASMFKKNSFSTPVNFYPMLRYLPGDFFGVNWIDNMSEQVNSWINKYFVKYQENFDPQNMRHFIDLCLLKEKEGYARKDLLKVVLDLFSAATDTTSVSLRWFILYLIKYPEIQKKCQEEVDKVIGESRIAAISDRINMPYVDATIHELLRHANVAPLAIPHDVRENTT